MPWPSDTPTDELEPPPPPDAATTLPPPPDDAQPPPPDTELDAQPPHAALEAQPPVDALPRRRARATLQRRDWVRAGLRVLARDGIEAVRIEAVARSLGVSKGSFYWHFADREELLGAMLAEWERERTSGLFRIHAGLPAEQKVIRLLGLVRANTKGAVDAAVHAWARKDPAVSARVDAIERDRIAWTARLLTELGTPPADAQTHAELANLVYLGWLDRVGRHPELRPDAGYLTYRLGSLLIGELPDWPNPDAGPRTAPYGPMRPALDDEERRKRRGISPLLWMGKDEYVDE